MKHFNIVKQSFSWMNIEGENGNKVGPSTELQVTVMIKIPPFHCAEIMHKCLKSFGAPQLHSLCCLYLYS